MPSAAAKRLTLDSDDELEDEKGTLQRFADTAKAAGVWTGQFGLRLFHLGAKYGGKTLWIVGTTTLMVVFPLMMEIEREQQVIELERLQVQDLTAKGVHPSDIAQMGLRVHEPAVLTS